MPEQDQLYVKIDVHEELVQELGSINRLAKNVEEASEVLDDLRELKQKTVVNIQENIVEMNQRLESINGEMPEVGETQFSADLSLETNNEVDESVQELHTELQTLKSELEELE